jgi:hypothetical protein
MYNPPSWPPFPSENYPPDQNRSHFLEYLPQIGRILSLTTIPIIIFDLIMSLNSFYGFSYYLSHSPTYSHGGTYWYETIYRLTYFYSLIPASVMGMWGFCCFASQSQGQNWVGQCVRNAILVMMPYLSMVSVPILMPNLMRGISNCLDPDQRLDLSSKLNKSLLGMIVGLIAEGMSIIAYYFLYYSHAPTISLYLADAIFYAMGIVDKIFLLILVSAISSNILRRNISSSSSYIHG